MSGIIGNIGSRSGIISETELDNDRQKYGWHLYVGSDSDFSSSAQNIDFNLNEFIGSNVSESGGVITVDAQGAGLYFITCSVSSYASNSDSFSLNFRVNNTQINGTRQYHGGSHSGFTYVGESMSAVVRVAASNTIAIYGTVYCHGNAADSMSSFSGCRIGDRT